MPEQLDFTGQVAVITGAGGGVGQAEGWAADENLQVTAADITDHWDIIRDPDNFTEPPHGLVSMATLERLRGISK